MGNNKSKGGSKEQKFDEASIDDFLMNIPLFGKLSKKERSQLAGCLEEKKYASNDVIVKQGENGDGFYIIKQGEVKVLRTDDKNKTTELSRLKSLEYFGETALLAEGARTATIQACSPTHCWFVSKKHFDKLFGKNKLKFAKRQAISAEKETKEKNLIPNNAVKTKSRETVQLILTAVKNNILFTSLLEEHKRMIAEEMYLVEVKKGNNIINQGEKGDHFYVVDTGEFDIFIGSSKVATRGKGGCFGELALMYNAPRAATVTAKSDSKLWAVDRYTFRRVVTDLGLTKMAQYKGFLKQVPLLGVLSDEQRNRVCEALEEVTFPADCVVIKQGDDGDCMYFVYTGKLLAVRNDGQITKIVKEYKTGDYFGERALRTQEPRAATIVTSDTSLCLKLDAQHFTDLMGPLDVLEKEFKKLEATYAEEKEKKEKEKLNASSSSSSSSTSSSSSSSSSNELKVMSSKKVVIPFSDLKVLGTLGKGSFGYVQLVKDKNNKTYALKAVAKQQIVETGQQGHIMSEKNVMARLDHPFLIKLHQTYKDKDRLFFLLEPCLGGELFTVLRARTLFDENTARFYAAHVVLAFEYMHSFDIIYRDLKPENLLLDAEGYLKITDFGFAKEVSSGRTWTLCGTPDYLAPEIVTGKGHGKGVDWWTLGILIYEMLAGYPPFYDEDPMKTYSKIVQGNVNFPKEFSKEAINLIQRLLQHTPTKRLGVVQGGATLIKQHPWFSGFDWDALLHRKLKAKIIPSIKSFDDTSNFDQSQAVAPEVPSYQDDGSGWDNDF
eukprot:TRINITY_DN364_c1_g6_i1.p1 TRINITY_DN364_c1_g6~~TRINITY_DN364_c1_g6_i1.p1  ORF type:complete len:778 (-),score=258.93 TRINITY_DN364_c1_g6_i1:217-2550(-)